jgi:methyltransferase (TIGR00027 family)
MILKVGELAKRTGLSIRALHHYDSIGLLSPSLRTDSGARLYGQQDLIRLHRIQALKHLGYGLPEIRKHLDDPGSNPQAIIRRQIEALKAQSLRAKELSERLEYINAHLNDGQDTSATDWLNLLEMMMMYKSNLTDTEMKTLRNPKDGAVRVISRQWTQLVSEVDLAITSGMDKSGFAAQDLAWRWVKLVIAMTSNDPVLANKLKNIQEREARAQEILGIDPVKFAWIGEAFAYARTALFAKYLSPDQTAEILRRQLSFPAHIDAWPRLMAQVREQMDLGANIEDESVQSLMVYWRQLFRDSYCGDDTEMEARVRHAFVSEPDLMIGVGVDEKLMIYAQKAMMHLHRPMDTSSNAGPKPSALMVAIQRAAHQLVDTPLVLNDPIAVRILGVNDERDLKANLTQFQNPMAKSLRASLVVRSRLAEDEWALAEENGVMQCVVLGAGLDTLAYRRIGGRGKIFEVDLLATQVWKKARLAEAKIAIPKSVSFVAADFQRITLPDALATAGFDAHQPAFFIWLGVVMYLDEAAIAETLRFISSCAKGSAVIFDYVVDPSTLPPLLRVPIEVMAKHLADRGEPWKTFYKPSELKNKMRASGFSAVTNFSHQALNERYLSKRSDGMQLNGLTQLILAKV